jgi:hypothetical protein
LAIPCSKIIFSVQSISKAVIKGHCVVGDYGSTTYGEFTGKALAEAEATIEVTEVAGCVPKVDY